MLLVGEQPNIKGEEGVTDFVLQFLLLTLTDSDGGEDDKEDDELDDVLNLFDELLSVFLFTCSFPFFSCLRCFCCWILVVVILTGITQLHTIPVHLRISLSFWLSWSSNKLYTIESIV